MFIYKIIRYNITLVQCFLYCSKLYLNAMYLYILHGETLITILYNYFIILNIIAKGDHEYDLSVQHKKLHFTNYQFIGKHIKKSRNPRVFSEKDAMRFITAAT